MKMTLNRSFLVYGAFKGVRFQNPTSYHQQATHLINLTVLMFFVLLCICVTGCQAGCSKCAGKYQTEGAIHKLDPEEMKAFKRSFLSKLGLQRPPSRQQVARANVSIDVLANMKRVYELSVLENNRSHELYSDLDTKRFFSFIGTGVNLEKSVSSENGSAESVRIVFSNFSLPNKRYDRTRVHTAKLQLYFKNVHLRTEITENRGRAEIYQLVEEPSRNGTTINQVRQLLDVRPVSFNNAGWVSFDIVEAVHRWEQDKVTASDSGLEILLSRPELRDALVLDEEAGGENVDPNTFSEHRTTWHPRMDVTVRESPRRRSRRSSRRRGTDCHRGESTCCRSRRTVSFAYLEWDYWIQSPNQYNAHYCGGSCSQGHRMANTYAVIKSQMHAVDPSEWNPPCCTASRLGPLPILHYDHESSDGYSVTVMDDWVVEECMCM